MIYSAQKPAQTLTFPLVQAFEIKREFETITNLQALGVSPFSLNLGPPGDSTTLVIKFEKSGLSYTLYVGNVLVLLPDGNYETYPTEAAFLAVYEIK